MKGKQDQVAQAQDPRWTMKMRRGSRRRSKSRKKVGELEVCMTVLGKEKAGSISHGDTGLAGQQGDEWECHHNRRRRDFFTLRRAG